jgi:hypothetical protein
MESFLDILVITLAVLITYQDIKQRRVHFIALAAFIGLLVVKAVYLSAYIEVLLLEILMNLTIVGVMILLLWIYFKFLRKKRLFEVIGMGDILLFVAFAIAFEAGTFIIHLTMSLVFSLIFHFIFKNHYKKHKTIPLAGFMCIYFIGILVMEKFHLEIPFPL